MSVRGSDSLMPQIVGILVAALTMLGGLTAIVFPLLRRGFTIIATFGALEVMWLRIRGDVLGGTHRSACCDYKVVRQS